MHKTSTYQLSVGFLKKRQDRLMSFVAYHTPIFGISLNPIALNQSKDFIK
ncbi:hypothetical protein [Pedobacter xixiisoli]|nr:hypothetical protein [Pedobacter xixiisoli]